MLVLQCSVCHHITGLKPPDGITEAATPRYQGECGERCGTVARCQCLFTYIGGGATPPQTRASSWILISSVIFTLISLIIISSSCHIM